MCRARRRSAGVGAPLLPLLLLLGSVGAEFVFNVPDVQVHHVAAATPKPVGSGRGNASRANASQPWAAEESLLEVRYEEYFVEHDVSTADARRAAADLDVEDVPASRPGCGACSARDREYCSARALADHCCCERRFAGEPFPWLPHTCYVGPRRCRPLAPDCAQYVRLRRCCCQRQLAEHWKSILAHAPPRAAPAALLALLAAVASLAPGA